MTRSVAEAEAQKIQKQAADFQQYAAKKQQEIQEEQVSVIRRIWDVIRILAMAAYRLRAVFLAIPVAWWMVVIMVIMVASPLAANAIHSQGLVNGPFDA